MYENLTNDVVNFEQSASGERLMCIFLDNFCLFLKRVTVPGLQRGALIIFFALKNGGGRS